MKKQFALAKYHQVVIGLMSQTQKMGVEGVIGPLSVRFDASDTFVEEERTVQKQREHEHKHNDENKDGDEDEDKAKSGNVGVKFHILYVCLFVCLF
ncbi:hypothetical protein RFI_20964, partial [Reticulomyxa filosa]